VRILLLGASGFIGRGLFAALSARGHEVVAAVRDASKAPPFASKDALVIDLNRDVTIDAWMPRLAGIDAVVNCAGVLEGRRGQSIEAIHHTAPAALFAACERAGVLRVVLISAISADRDLATAYARTKLAAEDRLRACALDWVVLRPSLVYAQGASGGTALFRALAALPFAVPVPGDGLEEFQPIHVDDLANVVAWAVTDPGAVRQTIAPVGPDKVSLRALLADYRAWLGLRAVPIVHVPFGLVNFAAWIGGWLGSPVNRTALAQLRHGNTGDYEEFARRTGLAARGWRAGLAATPAHAQDRLDAYVYFVRPLLRLALAFLWLASGLVGLLWLQEWAALLASRFPAWRAAIGPVLASAALLDLAIAALLVARWRPKRLAAIQFIVVAAYTAALALFAPGAWLEPLGPLVKNVPILAAILAYAAIERER
jgi:uncharacterized protein YbjT (DUF2867 family)